MAGDSDIYRGQVDQRTPLNVALCAIWYRLWQLTGFSSSGGGIVVSQPTGAPETISAVASSTTTIPSGAFNVGILILTGTGTINGVSWPVNIPYNVPGKINSEIVLALANPGTALVNYLL